MVPFHVYVAWQAAVLASGMRRAEALGNRVLVHALKYTSPAPIAAVASARNAAVSVEIHTVGHVKASDATVLTGAERWAVLPATAYSAVAAVVGGGRFMVGLAEHSSQWSGTECAGQIDHACDCTERKHPYNCERQRSDQASARRPIAPV